ncbi:MAG TPA: cyclic nucleotide-binding domain-containing protein, partial [Candidatus Polarisedimenticolia bacterium]|nr:cyclic nucleotide-binding domain-containing protein [Candidatus Polarisedimenticolia bacterium]
KAVGPTPWERRFRNALVVGYVSVVALGLTTDFQPRLVWTMLLPLLPMSIVLMGFPRWRRICPLAFLGELGRKLNRGTQRRVPKWLERWFFVVTFGVLLTMLVLRLVATNGDGVWLSGLLIGLALAAAATNLLYTGKTWCNFICPVGLVERIYTEPNSLPTVTNSQCVRCTACKKHCPDIDQENAYWQDVTATGRRIAFFAFPGLVLSFYVYYWLRYGDWEAYFDGRWTHLAVSPELVGGAGFFFAPQVPALLAAPLTLLVFSTASYAVFRGIEAVVGRFVGEPERRRHLTLTLAAFTAFSTFYFFAGAPTLRRVPGATRTVAFAAPLVATLFAVKRSRRTRERYIQEKGAVKLLRNWPFEDPPPRDPGEVFAWIKAGEHAREQQLTAYESTVREILADGLVGAGELRLLDEVRKQLGISEREHEKMIDRLSDEERQLFERGGVAGIEERAQLEGYQTALAEALLRRASASEVTELQRAFGVTPEAHARLLDRMRGTSGALLARARSQMEHALAVRRDLASLGPPDPTGASGFLSYLLHAEQEAAISRILEFLEIAGDAERVRALRPGLLAGETHARKVALRQLADACPGSEELVDELEPLILDRTPAPGSPATTDRSGMLERLAAATDPYLRAGAVWAAGTNGEIAPAVVARGLEDPHPLVRETAALCERRAGAGPTADRRFSSLATIEKMQFLRGVPLFAHLDPEDLEDLGRLTEDETVTAPAVLCEEGDVNADAVFIIVDGLASVVLRMRSASGEEAEREVALLGAGEVVGELSLLDGSPRIATVRPKDGPLRVLRIPGHLFRSRLLHRPRVAQPLRVTLARRLRSLSQRVTNQERAS